MNDPIVGHKTMSDGRHEPLRQSEAERIMARIEEKRVRRAELMPDEKAAISMMFEAYQRLKELGWQEGSSMPLTADRFAGIVAGSTGIHAYAGTRDDGPFAPPTYTVYDGDIWPTRQPPMLFRPWAATDVQQERRPCYPIPDDAEAGTPPNGAGSADQSGEVQRG